MATTSSYNKKSSSVKRLLSEARELEADASTEYEARPLEDNIFEWHFTLRGPSSSEFEKGVYHGRIILPAEYPFRPPSIMMLTPNGRFETNKKICLTFTGFHEEMWQPAWGIRTALLGVQGFMSVKAEAATGIGSLNFPPEERKKLADKSREWRCDVCEQRNIELLPEQEQGKRKEEALPDGLQVETRPRQQEHPTAQEGGSSTSSSANQPAIDAIVPQSQSMPSPLEVPNFEAAATANAVSTSQSATTERAQAAAEVRPAGAEIATPQASQAAPTLPSSNLRQRPLAPSSDLHAAQHQHEQSVPTPPISAASAATRQRSTPSPLQADQPLSYSQRPAAHVQDRPRPRPSPPRDVAPPAPEPPQPRQPTRSEVRVAQLDRAILTVVLLLLGLIVRRLL